MKKLILVITLFGSFLSNSLFAQTVEDIIWITEQYPPYNFSDKNHERKGLSIEILLKIWKKVGLNKSPEDIRFYPWARAYQMVQKQKEICLFSMSITKSRKAQFQFVGPIKGSDNGIIVKKSKGLKINSTNDLKTLQIGAVRKSLGEKLLIDTGLNLKFHQVVDGIQLVKMLEIDRLDAIILNYPASIWKMKQAGINPAQYEMKFILRKGNFGFAFNKTANPKMINLFQKAFDELSQDGTIEAIRDKYLK